MMTLDAKSIFKSYSKLPLLKNISLSVQVGESIAICGRSGEGKTTLLHILGTLEEADAAEIRIDNQLVTKSNASALRNQKIGFVFQSYNLLEDFTVLENVLMPARIARLPTTREKGLKLLSLVGLESKADLKAKHLSGGEKQRASIARALCNEPQYILADEPTGNLDRENGKKVGDILFSLVKEKKIGLILVTHDPDLAALSARRYLLRDGNLCFCEEN